MLLSERNSKCSKVVCVHLPARSLKRGPAYLLVFRYLWLVTYIKEKPRKGWQSETLMRLQLFPPYPGSQEEEMWMGWMDELQGKWETSGTIRFEEGGSKDLRAKWYLEQIQSSLKWWEVWKTFCMSRGWGSWPWLAWRRRQRKVVDAVLPSRARAMKKPDPKSSQQCTEAKGGEGTVRSCSKGSWNCLGKEFLIMGSAKHRNRPQQGCGCVKSSAGHGPQQPALTVGFWQRPNKVILESLPS